MVDALALDLGERFWANKSAFTRISFKVVLDPGSTLHAVRLKTARSERLITVVMDKTQEGVVVPSSQVSSPTGAFDLPGLSGIVSTPGWSGTTSEDKPFYWRQIYIAESDPVAVTLDNAAIGEYTEVAVPYDPDFPYVFTEYSGKGEWVSCIGQFGGGNLAELVRRTSGTMEGSETMWLTLFMMVLSFIASKASGSSTKKALGHALLAGGATYVAATQTEWGKDLSGSFDKFIGVSNADKANVKPAPVMRDVIVGKDENGNDIIEKRPVYEPVGGKSNGSVTGSLVDVWNNMSPAGKVLTGGAVTYTASSFLQKYGLWILGGIGAYLLLKD